MTAFRRSLPDLLVRRGATVALLFVGLVLLVTFLLAARMPGETLVDVLFEACSACSTAGLSTGVTARLDVFGKYVVMAGIFVGRLGTLALLLTLATRTRRTGDSYPEESIVIG